MIKKVLKVTLTIVLALLVIVAGYVIYVFAAYKRIPDDQVLDIKDGSASSVQTGVTYRALSYNIGFGAYEADYSFFMDGGESSWAKSEAELKKNIAAICKKLESYAPDIALLQEVDTDGTRTYHYDEVKAIEDNLSGRDFVFAQNFDSPFLFYPLTEPHGANRSGLLTMTAFNIKSAIRRSIPVADSVKKILDYDRCYSISRIPVDNGKTLCVYNLHLSAYGTDDSVREGQLGKLFDDIKKDLKDGNYIICGGDFNHNLRGGSAEGVPDWAVPFPREFLPDGTDLAFDRAYVTDIDHDSCRNADIPYIKGKTFTVLADGFIVSSNVEVTSYKVEDLEFKYSDHDPVIMEFILR